MTIDDRVAARFQTYLLDNAELSEWERSELPWRRIAFLAYAFVFLVTGMPVWWITTSPYRALLPEFETEFALRLSELAAQSNTFYLTSGVNATDDIWARLQPHSDYILHFIFVHNQPELKEIGQAHRIQEKINAYAARHLRHIGIRISVSSEHLWDFSISNFLFDKRSLEIDSADAQMPAALSSELDRLCSSPVSKNPLIKMALFFPTSPADHLRFMHKQKPTRGLSIASWGGFFSVGPDEADTSILNDIVSVLHRQLAIWPLTSGLNRTLGAHKQRLTVENLIQTVQILNSLHKLAEKIGDLIISDEVAGCAAQSKEKFITAYNSLVRNAKIDAESAADARRLAERANSDPSLLELLNFPSDQKYGIYVPLFLPLLVPLFQPLLFFIAFTLIEWKELSDEDKFKSSATMVNNMCAKLGKPRFRRACFDFKQAIMTTLNEYESWLINQEFIEERGVFFAGQYNEDKTDIGAEETLPPH